MTERISRESIASTYDKIRPFIRETPVADLSSADFGLDPFPLSFKLELLQHSGSFKARGAFANLLTRDIPGAGVGAASGGNHGAAVAFAAMKLGIPARIFVPAISSPAKLERIRAYGADLVVTGDSYAIALAVCQRWLADSGAMSVHAFDQRETLLGQGTLGLEFEHQRRGLNTVLAAVGGGGLIAGIAAWYSGHVKVIGVEPETAPTMTNALQSGGPVDSPAGGIAADSLAPKRIGDLVFPIAARLISSVVLVPDQAIMEAQRSLWDVLRIVVEPGGAAAFAALLSGRYKPEPGERVGVVVSGGNTVAVDFDRSPAAIS